MEQLYLYQKSAISLHGAVTVDYDVPFEWNPEDTSKILRQWLTFSPRRCFSVAEPFSSNKFHKILLPHISGVLSNAFRNLVLLGGYLFPHYLSQLQYDFDLQTVRNLAGSQVLVCLEAQLRSFRIEVNSEREKNKWQSLFLILLGTILVVSYTLDEVDFCM